eukprot:SAG22_NODE_5737_length_962_cov_1.436848_1_plen_60_part_10
MNMLNLDTPTLVLSRPLKKKGWKKRIKKNRGRGESWTEGGVPVITGQVWRHLLHLPKDKF